MRAEKQIKVVFNTLWDLSWNPLRDDYIAYLRKLIEQGYELEFHTIAEAKDAEPHMLKSVEHLDAFAKRLGWPRL